MLSPIFVDGILGQGDTFLPRIRGRSLFGIDGKEISTGRQSIRIEDEVSTGGRSSISAIQSIDKRSQLQTRTLYEQVFILTDVSQ